MKCLILPLAFVLAQVFAVCAQNPFEGTWKLNIQKSKFTGGHVASATYLIHAEGEKLRWDWEAKSENGEVIGSHTVARLDGTPAPMSTPIYDQVSMTASDARTITAKFTKQGKSVREDRFVVSKDGTTLTVIRTNGASLVYDKQ